MAAVNATITAGKPVRLFKKAIGNEPSFRLSEQPEGLIAQKHGTAFFFCKPLGKRQKRYVQEQRIQRFRYMQGEKYMLVRTCTQRIIWCKSTD